jgi:AcrR family transcriptional regulator
MAESAAHAERPAAQTAILSAAIEEIADRGYDRVRLRDIAQRAGVSIGLIQHHFGSRDELLGEAFEQHCAQLLEELADSEPDPWLRIVSLVDRLAESPVLGTRALLWAEFCASAARRPELRPHLRRVYMEWRTVIGDAIAEGVASGLLKPVLPAGQIVDLLLVQIDGALLAIAGDVGHMDGAQLHRLVVGSAELLLGRSELASGFPAVPSPHPVGPRSW